jgi:hypothetical protein
MVEITDGVNLSDIGRTSRQLSLKVELPPGGRADRDGFKACITVPRGSLKSVPFAYIVYEYRQDVDFRLTSYGQAGKYKRPGTTRTEFFGSYTSYEGTPLNLKTAPAVLVMLKNFRSTGAGTPGSRCSTWPLKLVSLSGPRRDGTARLRNLTP